jgi:division protein CdvB (Snf7/Vps24/ESCRT-III family)
LSNNFVSDWVRENSVPLSRRITEKINPVPLREKVTKTIYRLNLVQKKLDDSRLRMERKHKSLFNKCVKSQEAKDSAVAIMYANECSQVRKMAQTVITSQLAIEQVALRLETVKDFGDIATEVMPATKLIHALKGRLAGVIPEVSMQLGQIGQTLDSLVLEVGEATVQTGSFITSGEEAERVLAEATAVAEQKVRSGFPQLPTTESAEKGFSPP